MLVADPGVWPRRHPPAPGAATALRSLRSMRQGGPLTAPVLHQIARWQPAEVCAALASLVFAVASSLAIAGRRR